MKLTTKCLSRFYSLPLLAILAWSILTQAQGDTDLVVTGATPSDQAALTVTIEREGPALSFWLDRAPGMRVPVFGIPLWQYGAVLIYILLAIMAARIFDWLVVKWVKRSTETTGELRDMVIRILRGPVRMFAFVVLLQMGLTLFNLPEWLERWCRKGLYVLLAISITYMLMKVVDLAASFWKRRRAAATGGTDRTFNELLIPLVSKAAKIFVFTMALLVTLDNLGFNISTLLAGVSISGLVLGLAAQDTVGNLFGAAAVFVDKPFKIGDRVHLNGLDGTVEEIGLRSTRIRNGDGHLITVPNKTMGNATITNLSRRPNIKTVMNFGITYDAPAEKIEEAGRILNDVYKSHPLTHDVIIGFNQFGDSALNFMVIHWWKNLDYKEYLAGMQELNLTIKRRFDAAGINFAFPSRTIYLKQDSDWRFQLPTNPADPTQKAVA